MAQAVDGYRALDVVRDQLRSDRPDLGALGQAAARLPPKLVEVRTPELCDKVVASPAVAAAVMVLLHAPRLAEACSRKLRAELGMNSRPVHVVLAFVLVNAEQQSAQIATMIQAGVRTDLDQRVRTAVARCSQKRLGEMTVQAESLGPKWSELWNALVRADRRRLMRWRRADGR